MAFKSQTHNGGEKSHTNQVFGSNKCGLTCQEKLYVVNAAIFPIWTQHVPRWTNRRGFSPVLMVSILAQQTLVLVVLLSAYFRLRLIVQLLTFKSCQKTQNRQFFQTKSGKNNLAKMSWVKICNFIWPSQRLRMTDKILLCNFWNGILVALVLSQTKLMFSLKAVPSRFTTNSKQ